MKKFIIKVKSKNPVMYGVYNTDMKAFQYIDEWLGSETIHLEYAVNKCLELNVRDEKLSKEERQRIKDIEAIIIGIIASAVGVENPKQVCDAGMDVFKFIKKLTYEQFADIKNHNHLNISLIIFIKCI